LVRAFKKVPELINRIDEYYPPRGAAPPSPPLPDIEVIEHRGWGGYALTALLAAGIGAAVAALLI
jgi:ubiquinone biosynthesis protein